MEAPGRRHAAGTREVQAEAEKETGTCPHGDASAQQVGLGDPLTEAPTSPKKTTAKFTAEERAAMKDRVQEMKLGGKADGDGAVLAKIASMPEPDRAMGKRLHAIVRASAPALTPRLWYGMPAYAKNGKVLCFFQSAAKFKTRYATFAFSDQANLDDGALWPTAFALKELSAAEEAKIVALVKKAAR